MLNIKKAYAFFQKVYDINLTSKNWYGFDCPFCYKKKKCAVNFEYEVVKCWSCNYKNFITDFVMATEGLTYLKSVAYIESFPENFFVIENTFTELRTSSRPTAVSLPFSYKNILVGDSLEADRARDYLVNRGFNLESLSSMGVGYCDEKHKDFKLNYYGYIILPFKRRGRLYYYNARNFLGLDPRYKNPSADLFNLGKGSILWNEDALDFEERVFIMEGVFSALTVMREGVAIMGKVASSEQISKILNSDVEEVVVCLDNNCVTESFNLASQLIWKKKLKVLTLHDGDPNDLGYEKIMEIYDTTDFVDYGGLFNLLERKWK